MNNTHPVSVLYEKRFESIWRGCLLNSISNVGFPGEYVDLPSFVNNHHHI